MVANTSTEGRKLRNRFDTPAPLKRKLQKSDDEPREKRVRGMPSKELAQESDASLEHVNDVDSSLDEIAPSENGLGEKDPLGGVEEAQSSENNEDSGSDADHGANLPKKKRTGKIAKKQNDEREDEEDKGLENDEESQDEPKRRTRKPKSPEDYEFSSDSEDTPQKGGRQKKVKGSPRLKNKVINYNEKENEDDYEISDAEIANTNEHSGANHRGKSPGAGSELDESTEKGDKKKTASLKSGRRSAKSNLGSENTREKDDQNASDDENSEARKSRRASNIKRNLNKEKYSKEVEAEENEENTKEVRERRGKKPGPASKSGKSAKTASEKGKTQDEDVQVPNDSEDDTEQRNSDRRSTRRNDKDKPIDESVENMSEVEDSPKKRKKPGPARKTGRKSTKSNLEKETAVEETAENAKDTPQNNAKQSEPASKTARTAKNTSETDKTSRKDDESSSEEGSEKNKSGRRSPRRRIEKENSPEEDESDEIFINTSRRSKVASKRSNRDLNTVETIPSEAEDNIENAKKVSEDRNKKTTSAFNTSRRATRGNNAEFEAQDSEDSDEEQTGKTNMSTRGRNRKSTASKPDKRAVETDSENEDAMDVDDVDEIVIMEDFGQPSSARRNSRLKNRNKKKSSLSPQSIRKAALGQFFSAKVNEENSDDSYKPIGYKETSEDEETDERDKPRSPRNSGRPRKQSPRKKSQDKVIPEKRGRAGLRGRSTRNSPQKKPVERSSSSSSSSDSSVNYEVVTPKRSRDVSKINVSPAAVEKSINFQSIGGLESHIQSLKEIVVFPMMHPEVFRKLHISRAKRILFHGPSGTGKTLLARALANECNQGKRKVAFFKRKGSDYVSDQPGEAERHLRVLFEKAQKMSPSIIFLDDVDGISSIDQGAKVVSTLLALMDGLNGRGEVTVIFAANRLDAINPKLRTLARFDRELMFMLPSPEDRFEILKVHTSKWKDVPEEQLLRILAEKSIGYSGANLIKLCDALKH